MLLHFGGGLFRRLDFVCEAEVGEFFGKVFWMMVAVKLDLAG